MIPDVVIKVLQEYLVNDCAVSDMHAKQVATICVKKYIVNHSRERLLRYHADDEDFVTNIVLDTYSNISNTRFEKGYVPHIQEIRQMIYEIYDKGEKD